MDLDRVKYYGTGDYARGLNFGKIIFIEVPEYSRITINDAIEYFEIQKYFKEGLRDFDWSDEEYEQYEEKSRSLYTLANRYFSSLTDDSIIREYEEVEVLYQAVFWDIFDMCKVFKNISPETFNGLIHAEHINPFDVFRYKAIVTAYGVELREYILEDDECISVVLHWYEQNYNKEEKLYRPIEFTGEDVCQYLMSYIQSDHPDPNRLEVIELMASIPGFPITDKIRLAAKRKREIECEFLSKTGISLEYGIQLILSPEQTEEKTAETIDHTSIFSYSTHWLLDSLDYPSILNNFIYIFEYADVPQMRCLHVLKESQAGVFERAMVQKSSKIYPINSVFNYKNTLAAMQMTAYYNFLKAQDITLEDVLEDFFIKYLQREFKCPEMHVSFPSKATKFSEKCSIAAATFESILRQYTLYVTEGNIDFELASMSTTPIRFADVPSQIKNKYVYGFGSDFQHLTFLLFSDQCLLSYIPRIHEEGRSYSCLFDLLQHEKIRLSDYREESQISIQYLAKNDLLRISLDEEITLKDPIKLAILKDLFENDVISRWHYPECAQTTIDNWIKEEVLISKSSLFSDPEVNYLNYLLNRSEYHNGLELRNRYLHGIQQINMDEDDHMQNYFVFLRIFILLTIKINDDFDLAEKLSEDL